MEEIELYLDDAQDTMERALKHLSIELSKIRAGKATPTMLDGIQVEYYGMLTPLSQAATVNTPDARTIAIRPFEKKIISEIEKAIRNSNLGLAPQNDGEIIRLNIPALTEERRRDLVKKAKQEAETAKINIRNIRQDANNSIKKLSKDGVSEDAIKLGEEKVQKITDANIAKIEQILAAKEADVMSV